VESCRQALVDFEVRYPVSFALELEQLQEEKPTAIGGEPLASTTATKRKWWQSKKSNVGPSFSQTSTADRLKV